MSSTYSFTEKWYQENGTWLGATPPASASLVTSTQVVTLQPVPPGYLASQKGATPVTSYLTVSSTYTTTETPTETQTLAIASAPASTGAYTGLAFNAWNWNSSMLRFVTVKSPITGSATIMEKVAYHPSTAYPMAPSGTVARFSSNSTRYIKARDVRDVVVATIDGAVVSWTNSYDGTYLSTPDTSIIFIPVTATALQSEPEPSRESPGYQTRHKLTRL